MDDFKEKLIHLLHFRVITLDNQSITILKKIPYSSMLYSLIRNELFAYSSTIPPLNYSSTATNLQDSSFEFIHEQTSPSIQTNDIHIIPIFDNAIPCTVKRNL